jgi:hypothetical protein
MLEVAWLLVVGQVMYEVAWALAERARSDRAPLG